MLATERSSTSTSSTTSRSWFAWLLSWPANAKPFDLFSLELPFVDLQGMLIGSMQRVGVLRPRRRARGGFLASAAVGAQPTLANDDGLAQQDDDGAALRAFEEGSLGFGFSAGGFLFAYHVGVVSALRRWGLLHASTPLAGVSAGSLVAALVKCDVPTEEIERMYFECVEDLRSNGTAGRMREVLRAAMERHLPADAHERCSGSLHVGVSHLFPLPTHTQVSLFETREALIEALLTSCHLPHYSSNQWTVSFQGRRAVDGGFTAIVPTLPPSANAHTVKVCALPASRVARLPFLNKKQAMSNVAIIPDHPRGYHQAPSAPATPATARHASGVPASPRADAQGPQRPASCPPAPLSSPFAAASAAEPPQAATLPSSSATPSSGCSLSPAPSHNGALPCGGGGGGRAAQLASAVRRRLSSLASGGGSSSSLCSASADSGSECSSASEASCSSAGPRDEAGWRGAGERRPAYQQEGEGDDIVREMVAWINVPAPTDDFYVRLMRKAERDADAWVRSSGLAARLAPAAAVGSPRVAGAA